MSRRREWRVGRDPIKGSRAGGSEGGASSAIQPRVAARAAESYPLIDEGATATEMETLVPVMKGVKVLALVGDHMQLPPTVKCKEAEAAGMGVSLFEQIKKESEYFLTDPENQVNDQSIATQLKIQYRMHVLLSDFRQNCITNGVY